MVDHALVVSAVRLILVLYGVEYAGAIWMGSTKLSGGAALCEELEGCVD